MPFSPQENGVNRSSSLIDLQEKRDRVGLYTDSDHTLAIGKTVDSDLGNVQKTTDSAGVSFRKTDRLFPVVPKWPHQRSIWQREQNFGGQPVSTINMNMTKPRILVVDDDRLVADTLSMVFMANGFDSEARYSAADALERARSFDPGLMLCDITMPGGNGLQLVQKMHDEMPHCKVLMLTAYTQHDAGVALQAERMNRPLKMLSKPCRPEVLLREAQELLLTA